MCEPDWIQTQPTTQKKRSHSAAFFGTNSYFFLHATQRRNPQLKPVVIEKVFPGGWIEEVVDSSDYVYIANLKEVIFKFYFIENFN